MNSLAALALSALAVVSPPPPATTGAGSPGPTIAVEDTMHTQVPEVLVRAPRVTLAEILDRVARGEARRDSMIRDQTFLSTARVVGHVLDEHHEPVLIAETVARVYKKRPNKLRTVMLRHYAID